MENIKNGAATDPETTSLGSDLARSASEHPTAPNSRATAESPAVSDESAINSEEGDRDGSPPLGPNPLGGEASPSDTRESLNTPQNSEENSDSDATAFEALLG